DASAPDERTEDECSDLTSTATEVVPVALVEDDEDDVTRPECRQDAAREGAKPAVAGPDRAVVHVVAQARHDEREGRKPPPPEIPCKFIQGHDSLHVGRTREDVRREEERDSGLDRTA